MLDRLSRRAWGISGRLIASYVLVTLAVVVLVEALVLGYQAPGLVIDARLQTHVSSTAKAYAAQLLERYPGAPVPARALLGDPGQPPRAGQARLRPDGATLVVPAIGPIAQPWAVTAIVAVCT